MNRMKRASNPRKTAAPTPWSARRRNAANSARELGTEALLVTHLPDVRYLCGFTGSSAALALDWHGSGLRARLFTDGRYTAQAKAEAIGMAIEIGPRPPAVAACEWLAKAGVTRCGFDPAHTTVAALEVMRKALPASSRRMLMPVTSVLSLLREVKDLSELASMRKAAALGCDLFEQLLGFLEPGMTELAVAAELEHRARLAGAEAMSFETIVASGVRSSLPHGRASTQPLPKKGFCTLDFGVVLDGYCSDMTRTVHFGPPTEEERRVYEAVLLSQETGVAAVREGVLTSNIDAAARGVLDKAGLGKWFSHSTGHGVGLEIHEGPRLAKRPEGKQKSEPERLRSGMVVTIEPGVYLPGRFGVRIEDTVVVTSDACEILTPATKAWIEL